MIYTQAKRYSMTLWPTVDRSGLATQAQFDELNTAKEAFEASKISGQHKAGLLMEWDKRRGDWTLIDQFP